MSFPPLHPKLKLLFFCLSWLKLQKNKFAHLEVFTCSPLFCLFPLMQLSQLTTSADSNTCGIMMFPVAQDHISIPLAHSLGFGNMMSLDPKCFHLSGATTGNY